MEPMKAERVRAWENERRPEDTIEIPATFADRCRWERMGYQDDQPGTAIDVMSLMDEKERDIRFFAKAQSVLQKRLELTEAAQLPSITLMPRLSRIYVAIVQSHFVWRFGSLGQFRDDS